MSPAVPKRGRFHPTTPRGLQESLEGFSTVMTGGHGASGILGVEAGVLLTTLQCRGQPPTTGNDLARRPTVLRCRPAAVRPTAVRPTAVSRQGGAQLSAAKAAWTSGKRRGSGLYPSPSPTSSLEHHIPSGPSKRPPKMPSPAASESSTLVCSKL